ncbi:MAG: GntR family transcriptional regulator, partial [Pseudorhodoplanes sp.]
MKTSIKGARKAIAKSTPGVRDESNVERLYYELRDRAMRYDFKPGSRINEKALGEQLGVARATLREALNRLVAEGLLEFVLNKGFFRKAISVDEVFDLYQVRIALERRAVLLAIQRASDADIAAVKDYWVGVMQRSEKLATGDLLLADEEFHRRLIALSGNKELASFMEIVARRIHVARHIDIEQ